MNKEQLIRILAPLITKNGDITASTQMLQGQTVEKLKELWEQQPKAVREMMQRIEQQRANDPEVQREREQAAEALEAARKAREDATWVKFFFVHPDVLDIAANRVPLETYALSIGGITLPNLEEALAHRDIGPRMARTALKTPATKENLKQDEATLRKYCREHRLCYGGEAALRFLRERFGVRSLHPEGRK